MNDPACNSNIAALDAVSEGTPDPDLDIVLIGWQHIASLAWHGFITHGRGAVIIHIGANVASWTFHPGGPCSCFAQAVETYDPEHQVVVSVVRDGEKAVYVLDGWPPPPAAFVAAPANALEATLH
jgi:hypothetical protein